MLFAHLHSHGVRRDHAQCRCKPKWGPRTTIGELPKLCVKMRPDSWLVCGPFRCHRLPYWLSIFWRTFFTRHLTEQQPSSARKFLTYVTWVPWAYVRPPDREVRGISTGSVNAEPVCRLCQLIINKINSHVRQGARKKFWSRGPPGNLPVSRWASPPLAIISNVQNVRLQRRHKSTDDASIRRWHSSQQTGPVRTTQRSDASAARRHP